MHRLSSVVCLAFLSGFTAISFAAPERVRGITISTHTDGRDWASKPVMDPALREVRELGAGWVAIHPYARIRADGTVQFRKDPAGRMPAHVTRPVEMAHAAGLKIMIKPHLAYWGSPFKWRGEIEFDDDAAWTRFWQSYEDWILAIVKSAPDADGFAVGTELDRTLKFEDSWRRLIAGVREITDRPLTYAANWTDYQRVPFWDALDVIGIQAYFPLTAAPSPESDVLRTAWQSKMDELRAYAQAHHRSILFTEIGYSRAFGASVEPWSSHVDGDSAAPIQERCMREALAAIEREPLVVGAFLWKWFPGSQPNGRNFRLATPGMRRVITDAWAPSIAAD